MRGFLVVLSLWYNCRALIDSLEWTVSSDAPVCLRV